jgi:hypothetical protein
MTLSFKHIHHFAWPNHGGRSTKGSHHLCDGTEENKNAPIITFDIT